MAKHNMLRVGETTFDVGTPMVIQGFFATISQNFEPNGRGSRFPLIMNHLYTGRLGPEDASAAWRELEVIELLLLTLPIDKVVWGAAAAYGGGSRRCWVNGAARNVRDYLIGADGRPLISTLFEALSRSRGQRESVYLDAPFNWHLPTLTAWLLGGYCAVGFAYLMYSVFTQTGISGHVMALQMRLTGYGSYKLTMILAMLLLMMPILIVGSLLEKFAPHLVRKRAKLASTKPPEHFAASWRRILAVTSLALLIGSVVTAGLAYRGYQEQSETVFALNLNDKGANLPANAKFVELTGVLAGEYANGYTEGRHRAHVYAPVTAANWEPSQPIRYILHYETSNLDRDHKPILPADFRSAGSWRIGGRLTASLPVIVQQQYKAEGLKFGPSYQVVNWTELPDRQVPASGRYDSALIAGVATLLTALFVFAVLALLRRTFVVSRQTIPV